MAKRKDYKYGVSYNCVLGGFDGDEIGGGGEGCTSIDFVGDDLDKVISAVIKDAKKQKLVYEVRTKHKYVGEDTDVGGSIVAVIGEKEGRDLYVACVVFEDPDPMHLPIVVK